MIDAGLKVLDLLKELLNGREESRKQSFLSIIEPMYKDAEIVVRDYLALLHDLQARIERREPIPDVIRWLEGRRLEVLPVRLKMRAVLSTTRDEALLDHESVDRFQKGIWGLMKGGLTVFEEGHAPLREYDWGDHTVLDLMYRWATVPQDRQRYGRYAASVNQQVAAIQRAWGDVVEGYADLRQQALE